MPEPDRSTTPFRIKKIVFTLVASVVPLLLLGLVAEIALRLLEPPLPGNSGQIVRLSADPEKKYELVPGSAGTLAGAPVSVNRFGCRDRDYPQERSPGVARIVGIGDSLTFGQGVRAEETFLARLEEALAARGLRVEVINCGVFGYNVDEESRRFDEVVALLNPDLVLIGYELGDLLRNPPVRKDAVPDEGAERAERASLRMLGMFDLLKRSRVVTFIAYRYSFLLKKLSLRNWDSLYADDSPLWRNLSAKYAAMAENARARKIDVAVAIIPELSNLDERYPFSAVHERVAAMCRAQGMHAIDLLPAFLGQDGPRLWVHPQDRHPNARGHQIIADALLEPVAALMDARAAATTAMPGARTRRRARGAARARGCCA